MNDTDLSYLSGVELRRLYERRELSPVEVTEAVLRRIEALDPRAQRLRHGHAGAGLGRGARGLKPLLPVTRSRLP